MTFAANEFVECNAPLPEQQLPRRSRRLRSCAGRSLRRRVAGTNQVEVLRFVEPQQRRANA